MIDKEACVPKTSSGSGAITDGAAGEEDDNNSATKMANGPNGHVNGQTRKTALQQNGRSEATANGRGGGGGGATGTGTGEMDVDEEL